MVDTTLTVLGTWGLATIGETPSFLIESEEGNILLDMCPGVTRQLKRMDFDTTKLDYVFGSHSHADHILGATYLLFQHSVETRGLPEEKKRLLKIYGPESVINGIKGTINLHYPERGFEFDDNIIYSEKSEINVNDKIKFTFSLCDHTVECYGIRIELKSSKKIIVYTSDGIFNQNIEELAKEADLLIGEAFGTLSDYENVYKKVKHSLGIHLGEFAKTTNIKSLLPFHMHPRYGQDPYKKKEILSEIKENYNGDIFWPEDLLKITL